MVLIYRIDGGGLTYVGSTIRKLQLRLSEHENKYKIWKEGKTNYVTSFDVVHHDHKITLIEECTDENRKEREAHWIRTLTCVNKKIEGRTPRQYYQDNKDRIHEWNKQYRKDIINQKFECPCGGKYTHTNKSRHFKSKLHQAYLNQA
tara:strand:+ start:69 stop:509 length:441 start_codon:yes stop_codon:yes gene_type:complete